MPEGSARSGDGMGLAKGRCVRAESRGRGFHENRVGAVAGHAALNHVDTNFWRAGAGGRASRAFPGLIRRGRGATKEPVVVIGWMVPRLKVSSQA